MNSKPVTSTQDAPHEKLLETIEKYKQHPFKKELTEYSLQAMQKITDFVSTYPDKMVVFDMGCGVGMSTFYLAQQYDQDLVIGIDKSNDRLYRNNNFKKDFPTNALLIQGDLIDLWRLIRKEFDLERIRKQYILYPNPWPKKSQYQKRWPGHPVVFDILQISSSIELRSNWSVYLQEFELVAQEFGFETTGVKEFEPELFITPFEKKYFESHQNLYRLELKRGIERG